MKSGTIIVVAPHPDDEVIGAAALILAARRAGKPVRVIVVSDGSGSHRHSRRWPRARLIAQRQRETARALRRVGVARRDIVFLGLPDGMLARQRSTCVRALRRAIARGGGASCIVGPSPEDAHPDHRTVAEALGDLRTSAQRLAYRVWPHDRRRCAAPVTCVGAGHAWKRSLIGCYRTQLGSIRDDPDGFAIAPHELRAFAHPIERFERPAQ